MILVLEGLPGSGKTTLGKILEKRDGFLRIGEVLDNKGRELCPKDFAGFEQKFFLSSDSKKYLFAINSKKKHIVIDRSPISTIAYNICICKEKRDEIILRKLETLSKKYFRKCIFIYLRIDPEISLMRKPKKTKKNDAWSSKKNLKKTKEIYDSKFFNNEKVFILDGKKPLSNLYKEIKALISIYSNKKFIEEE